MKIIKIIDLLMLITDKEELPKKIKVLSNGEIFTYEKEKDDYIGENDDGLFNECILSTISLEIFLNEEVEIIEEEKEIEKLNLDTDKLLKNVVITAQDYVIEGKINELIDAVNELKRGN